MQIFSLIKNHFLNPDKLKTLEFLLTLRLSQFYKDISTSTIHNPRPFSTSPAPMPDNITWELRTYYRSGLSVSLWSSHPLFSLVSFSSRLLLVALLSSASCVLSPLRCRRSTHVKQAFKLILWCFLQFWACHSIN